LREISAELASRGYVNENGKPYAAASGNGMLTPGRRQAGGVVNDRVRRLPPCLHA
jgi:hypothetical protein